MLCFWAGALKLIALLFTGGRAPLVGQLRQTNVHVHTYVCVRFSYIILLTCETSYGIAFV